MTKIPPPGVTVTYQYQFRKCGKASCNTCNKPDSVGHGKYWYAYWHDENRKMHSRYYGKDDPRSEAQKEMDTKKRELRQLYKPVKAEVLA
jgi:hypothetical protein